MMADSSPDPQAIDLTKDVVTEFGHEANSADQPTANDTPVVRPSSGVADPEATGTY